MTLSFWRYRPSRPAAGTLLELAGGTALLVGIGLIYLPAALIVGGGLFIFLAQGVGNDTADE